MNRRQAKYRVRELTRRQAERRIYKRALDAMDRLRPPPAAWTGTRYYFVDSENGDDSNPGWSDIGPEHVRPIKTLDALKQRIPLVGTRAQNISVVLAGKFDEDLEVPFVGYGTVLYRGQPKDTPVQIRRLKPPP